jgi:predicted permease
LLLRLISPDGPLPLHTELNGSVLAFTAGTAILSGLLFGLAPAVRTTRFDLVSSLKESRAGQQPDGFSRTFGRMLVVSQIVLSVILLVFAGLFLGTLRNLRSIDVGYARKGLLLLRVDPRTGGYKDAQVKQMNAELLARLQQIPGVEAVSYSENGLFSGTENESDAEVEGYKPRAEADKENGYDRVGPRYFEVAGTRIVAGRGIGPEDNEHTQKVAVINEKMARFYFPHGDAIGRHLFDKIGNDRVAYTIVGVVGDAKQSDLRLPAERRFYVSFLQRPDSVSFVNFEIRTYTPSERVIAAVRRAIADFNRNLPVVSMESADELVDNQLVPERLVAEISGFFGVLALVLGAIGLYGVMAYMTARRTAEIGIRLALGAERRKVIQMVLGETWPLLAMGLAIGVVVSTAMARVFEKSLFGVTAFDPATTIWAVAVISLAALLAAYLPARKAARVDPLIALRYE